jgi:hypothetical protein
LKKLELTALPWWLGFFLTVNLFLIPSQDKSPRFTDLIAIGLALWLLVRSHRRGLPALPLAALAVTNVSSLLWTIYAFSAGENSTMVEAARWVLAMPWALTLLICTETEEDRVRFAWGLTIGCAVNAMVVFMQYAGLDSLLKPLGIAIENADRQIFWANFRRLSGLHRQHAATASVTSLIAPASIYLYMRGRAGLWLPLTSLALAAGTLHLTFTRSPAAVIVGVLAVAFVTARQARRSVVLASMLFAVGLPALVVIGPPGGKARWGDSVSLEVNAGERVRATISALEISLENPQGLGVERGRIELVDRTAINATHNAFFQASLHLGLLVSLILTLTLLHMIWRLLDGGEAWTYLASLMALHLFGLFLFEEHLNNPTFIVLVGWLIAVSTQRISLRRSRAGA